MGLKIAIIESSFSTKNHYLVVSLVRALRDNPEVEDARLLDLTNALEITGGQTFDVLLVFGGENCQGPTVRQLCDRARVSVVWFTEDPYEIEHNLSCFDMFDIVLTNDRSASIQYGKKGHHLPLAGEKSYTSTFVPYSERRYDISFVGTLWPNRARFFAEASATLRNLKTKFELIDNEYIRPALQGIPVPYPIGSGVDYLDFMRIAAQSRLSLMIDRDFSGSARNTISDTPGPRFFEAAAAGACILVDTRVSGEQKRLGFVDGEDYFGFASASEFKLLIHEYLTNPALFEAAARRVQKKIELAHTYHSRVRVILDLVNASLKQAQPEVRNVKADDSAGKPRVLALAHNLPEFGNFGGGELYLESLMKGSPQFEWYTLAHDSRKGYGTNYILIDGQNNTLSELRPSIDYRDLYLRHAETEMFFLKACETVKPDVILVNHLHGLPPTLPLLARSLGIPYVLVLHDFYLACDEFNLLMPNQVYCGVKRSDSDKCDICTYKRRGIAPKSQVRRRVFYRQVISHAAAVVSNTSSTAELISELAGVGLKNLHIIAPPGGATSASSPRPAADQLRNVALIGNLYPNKGSRDLVEIAAALSGSPVCFHVFGRYDQAIVDELFAAGLKNVRLHGPYQSGKLPAEIEKCEVALFLSKWPETYCMTLTEALALGLVPIVYNLGALGERVSEDIGFRIEPHPQAAATLLRELLDNPQGLRERAVRLASKAAVADDFLVRYNDLIDETIGARTPFTSYAYGLANTHLGLTWSSGRWDQDTTLEAETLRPMEFPPAVSAVNSTVNSPMTLHGRKKPIGAPLVRSALQYLRMRGVKKTAMRVREWLAH